MSDENSQAQNTNPQTEPNPRIVSVRPMVSEHVETKGLTKVLKTTNGLTASGGDAPKQ